MATIREVAVLAGVAPITVSRVLNGSGAVRAETRSRVEAVIEELGYVPNMLAQSLRSHRTNTLALILTDVTNPFWTTVARGVEDTGNAKGFHVILCNTDEKERKQADYIDMLLRRRVDGFLLAPARSEPVAVQEIQRQKVPVVVLDRRVPGAAVDSVRSDSEQGACMLVRYLLELGHRRIAIFTGPLRVSSAVERVEGYRRALLEASITPDEDLVFEGDYTVEDGYCLVDQLLARSPQPTALFASNNFMAAGAARRLRERGLVIPDDISLVGFDDLPYALVEEPFLTIAAQAPYEMGRLATELLLDQLANHSASGYGPNAREPQEIILPTQLIIRRSCRPPKADTKHVMQPPMKNIHKV